VIINLGSWIARLGIPVGALQLDEGRPGDAHPRPGRRVRRAGHRVNGIPPGVIRAPDLATDIEHPGEAFMRGTLAGRPDAIAAAAVYLASGESAIVHGTVIDVDGGRVGVAVVAQPAATATGR
jgi:hypothetical protein